MNEKDMRRLGYRRCAECRDLFKAYRKDQKTCTQACRTRLWRRSRGV